VIWSEEVGREGAPLVALVHGSMDRSAGLLRLSRRLDHAHRVLRYDRRGYGRSFPHDGPFRMDEQVGDLERLLDGRPAVVVGHSYGGNVALSLAARRPDLVRGVAVYEPPLSWLEWWPTTTAGEQALAGGGDPADAAERFVRRLIGDARWERLPPRARATRRREGVAMVGELADLRARAPWSPDQIEAPLVAVRGEHGAVQHRHGIEHLAAVVTGCAVVVIPGAKHFGPNTHPDDVAQVVTAMVSRVGAR
jgi:pimeloyl-ACP methyl ester carboxylesterase